MARHVVLLTFSRQSATCKVRRPFREKDFVREGGKKKTSEATGGIYSRNCEPKFRAST
jgi:hypothetical protein